jgi:hypothetical protein
VNPRFTNCDLRFTRGRRYKWPCVDVETRAQMTSHSLSNKFKWLLVSLAMIFLGTLIAVLGSSAYFYYCGYQLHKQCPLIGLPRKVFLAGAKARLDRNVNYAQLQSWAAGVTPNGPQKDGAPIHLPNGETITPTDWRGDGAHWGEDGSFTLLTNHLPPALSKILPQPPGIIVHGDVNPAMRHVKVGYWDRFGLNIVIGPSNYVYSGGLTALKCTNGIYIFVGGGG